MEIDGVFVSDISEVKLTKNKKRLFKYFGFEYSNITKGDLFVKYDEENKCEISLLFFLRNDTNKQNLLEVFVKGKEKSIKYCTYNAYIRLSDLIYLCDFVDIKLY